jgi:arsenical pump membrane protein
VIEVVLLGVAVALVLLAHQRIPPAAAVGGVVVVALVGRVIEPRAALDAVEALAAPLGFLALAVPLAVLLDRIGFFDAAAERVASGHRLRPSLWAFAAAVTTLFNLDAAIVLLTPLYVRIARRHGLDPLLTAFQPVLLASLASSALPVSNLTNLIVAEHLDAGPLDFLLRLGPVSLVATVLGWVVFRRVVLAGRPPVVVVHESTPADRRAFRVGVPAVAALLVGFTLGDAIGIPAWMVAGAVTAALMVTTRTVPWRAVPVGAITVAAGLAILAAAAAPSLPLDRVLGGTGPTAELRAAIAGVIGADVVNNLPALLVGLPFVEEPTTWAFLAGVNLGPLLWVSGSLAGLLWSDIVRREGLHVTPLDYARVGVRVGLPVLAVSIPVVLLTSRW